MDHRFSGLICFNLWVHVYPLILMDVWSDCVIEVYTFTHWINWVSSLLNYLTLYSSNVHVYDVLCLVMTLSLHSRATLTRSSPAETLTVEEILTRSVLESQLFDFSVRFHSINWWWKYLNILQIHTQSMVGTYISFLVYYQYAARKLTLDYHFRKC